MARFVCAVRREISQPVLLRSYRSRGGNEVNCTIAEAGRATSAAPLFFDPITIGIYEQEFVDGATGCNNPIRQLLSEARATWSDANTRIQCMVSIGTGQPRVQGFGDNIVDIAKALVKIATETELTAESFLREHHHLGLSSRYFRFNVARGMEDIGLEEYAERPKIASATMAFLSGHTVSEDVQACVRLLKEESLQEIVPSR
jgi:hypothetical protein